MSLQALRATHQSEVKKKEKEIERMTERWQKISDSQLKLGNVPSGLSMTSANVRIVESSVYGPVVSKNILETALEEAQEACHQLREENSGLKALVADIANAVQKILHRATTEDPENFDYVRVLLSPSPISYLRTARTLDDR